MTVIFLARDDHAWTRLDSQHTGRVIGAHANLVGGHKNVKGFRSFLMRGNLIDLAIAVVVGTAFTAVVTAIVKDLITPLIAAIGAKPNFENLTFTVHHSTFAYGDFINALVSFVIIAAVVYFLIVAPVSRLTARLTRNKAATERDCPECLSSIPVAATRCMYCTTIVQPVTH